MALCESAFFLMNTCMHTSRKAQYYVRAVIYENSVIRFRGTIEKHLALVRSQIAAPTHNMHILTLERGNIFIRQHIYSYIN